MLFFIIFGIITIAAIVVLVVLWAKGELDECAILTHCFWGGLLGVAPLIICGIIAGYCNSSLHYHRTEAELTETIDSLHSTYNILITNVDNESYKISIQQYNQDVKDFRTKIKEARLDNDNLWLNAFINNIYNEARFNPDVVSYI